MRGSIQPTVKLNNGVEIPVLGLGVYQTQAGEETRRAVTWALELGYRHIDTAKIYGNERDVGEAVRASGVRREDVFITTKLWNRDHGYDATLRACSESLKRLGVSYIDLYLIHWPVKDVRGESWRAMTTLLKEGKCRSIGVSNYTIGHLKELLESSPVVPAVNQVELSPFLYQKDLIRFCHERGIRVEAYSPLVKGERMSHPALVATAAKYGRTPAQILVRWAIQHDLIVLPKSARRARIQENAAVFDFTITPRDMAALDALDENLRMAWDPTHAP